MTTNFRKFGLLFISTIFTLGQMTLGRVQAQETYSPKIEEKSEEGALALHRFKIPGGFQGELFAAEPQLANPVAFCIDEKGRIFVAETFRQSKGVEDNRGHMDWVIDDLAAQTVADRIRFFKKHLKEHVKDYGLEHDRIRRLVDTDGDGRADEATVFADGFNHIEEGTGAGLLALNGTVYYTCIPRLWALTDPNDDGVADAKQPLHDGFGVRVAFRGHDLHGLILGPDGRLYFSIGDRGYNIVFKDGTQLAKPDQGAVFRCELDGSNLEVFCTGLRNPQELAFDDFGNLFTGDNNSDSGDRARWVYLVEGSDTGWRMYYQYPQDRGPWNREKLWHVHHPGQAAYIVPPVAHFADGPSGLAYYPGTGLDEKYRGNFFLADFRGQASNSGIRTFSLVPKGASFELVNPEEFVWSILATDIDFGYDGEIYVSDWVDGWDGLGKGRIYRFRDELHSKSPVVSEVKALMGEGFESRTPEQLSQLLGHADYRIRLRAQLAMATKGNTEQLTEIAISHENLFARVHAIWGLGQIGRKDPSVLKPLLPLAQDRSPEVRAQVARVCGEAAFAEAGPILAEMVKDLDLRVRSLAAIAVGKLKYKPAFAPLLEALAENADADSTLRHALVMGLVGTASAQELLTAARIPNTSIRLGVVVALRRLASPGLGLFLTDVEPLIVTEAARAIHDLPVPNALEALAQLLDHPGLPDPVARRAMSANFHLGTKENAEVVATYAGNPLSDEVLRIEALAELTEWNAPGPLDRVTGDYRPLDKRNVDIAEVIRPWMDSYFAGSPNLREAAVKLATQYAIGDVEPYLIEILSDAKDSPTPLRASALAALHALKSPQLASWVEQSLEDEQPAVRSEARRILAAIDPARAVRSFAEIMAGNSTSEQQSAVQALASLKREDADEVIGTWLDKMVNGAVPPVLHLDLLNAAETRGTPRLLTLVKAFNSKRSPADHLKDFREALEGGNADRGREIFFGRADVSCRRCHKIDNSGGEVGPDLSGIGLAKSREYLLEALVDPNKQIAKGFETAILSLQDGRVFAGIVKDENNERLRLHLPDGQLVTIPIAEIEERTVGKSGMPEDLVKKLTKSEIRDLVEFLAQRKSPTASAAHGTK
ncbi:PVC-type heme-binding CxxCH protein [Schlesneria sp. DSM 10557]|uniref:PVC-type heme-binding CxxCH protein n=1 Tax=Schlesneria sp. DSM 10557 TaxID=3044399 RepID=UPI00359FB26C